MLMSCNSKHEFDSIEWKKKGIDWWMTDFREKMIEDLIEGDTLIGLNQEQVLELLGPTKDQNDTEMIYLIREKYGLDIDPEYISNLHLKLDMAGRVIKCEVKK